MLKVMKIMQDDENQNQTLSNEQNRVENSKTETYLIYSNYKQT